MSYRTILTMCVIICVLSHPALPKKILSVPSSSFPDLQSAVLASDSGDVIQIENGIYYNFCGTTIPDTIAELTIMGGFDTTIDCNFTKTRALTINTSSITLTSITFQKGYDEYGGAVAIIHPLLVSVNVSNCTFAFNAALSMGAADGGGLYISAASHSVISVTDCNFISNNAVGVGGADGGGLCIIAASYSVISVTDCSFTRNTVLGFGGGLCVVFERDLVHSTRLSITGGTFHQNSGRFGGGVSIVSTATNIANATIAVQQGSYLENMATLGGAGISIFLEGNFTYSSTIRLQDLFCSLNTAHGYGGGGAHVAINDAVNTSVIVEGGNFWNNSAPVQIGKGGGFSINTQEITEYSYVILRNVSCSLNNAVTDGGGAYVSMVGGLSSGVIVEGGSFTMNVAMGSSNSAGGGLEIVVTGTVDVNVSDIYMSQNVALHDGGGLDVGLVYATNCNVWIQGGIFTNNTAQGDYGGAISLLYSLYSYTNNGVVRNVSCYGNVGQTGGCLSVNFNFIPNIGNHSALVVEGGSFYHNEATVQAGGAISISFLGGVVDPVVTVRDVICGFNVADGDFGAGGAVAINFGKAVSNAFVLVERGLFFNNHGNGMIGGGGAVAIYLTEIVGSHVKVLEGYYSQNIGDRGGGGVAVWMNAASMSEVLLRNVSSVGNSGGIFGGAGAYININNADNTTISIDKGRYMRNRALAATGGGIQVRVQSSGNGSSVVIKEVVCGMNSAMLSEGGGAIQILYQKNVVDTSILIADSHFYDNVATQAGGVSIVFQMTDSIPTNAIVNITGSSFLNNSATAGNAGGLSLVFPNQINNAPTIKVSMCTFESNSASGLGGGALLALPPASSSLLSSKCSICTAAWHPEYMEYFPPADPSCHIPISVSYCTQFQNASNYVQNYYVPYEQHASLEISNVSFVGNRVQGMGGALVVSNGNVTVYNVSFVNNTASEQAAGLVSMGTTSIRFAAGSTVLFANNTALSQTDLLLLNSQGNVHLDTEAQTIINSAMPPKFTADQGQFEAVSFIESGETSFMGRYHVQCPPGFQFHYGKPQNVSVFVAGWPNAMLAVSSSAVCAACGVNFYSMQGGHMTIDHGALQVEPGECHGCPFGADCSLGINQVLATKDYWGHVSDRSQTWNFTRCPLGYCCQQEGDAPCEPYSAFACVHGRAPSSPLCGSCLPGYSQNLGGNGCTLNENCNEGKWVFPTLVALAFAWCIILVWTSGSKMKKRNPSDDKSWILPTLLFFYQNVYFLFTVQGGLPTAMVDFITSITNLHLSSTSPSKASWTNLCVMPDLSTPSAIALQLLVPAIVLTIVLIYYTVARAITTTGRRSHWIKRASPAAAKTIMLSYSTLVSVCGTLLHCVPVGVGEDRVIRVIFKAGAVGCETMWIQLLWAVFGIVVLPFPFLLFSIQLFIRKRGIISNAIASIEEPYQIDRWFWPSVVLLRRLAVALVYSLDDDPASQGIWFSILFMFFLVAQLFASPHRSMDGNAVETCSMMILTIISLCTLRTGSYFEANVVLSSSPTARELNSRLNVVQTGIFIVPLVLAAALLIWGWLKVRFGWKDDIMQSAVERGSRWLKISVGGTELTSCLLETGEQQQETTRDNGHAFYEERIRELEQQLEQERQKMKVSMRETR